MNKYVDADDINDIKEKWKSIINTFWTSKTLVGKIIVFPFFFYLIGIWIIHIPIAIGVVLCDMISTELIKHIKINK